MDKLYDIKIEIFCFSKDTIKKMKRKDLDWEKIFSRHIFNKGLVSEYTEKLITQ